MANPDKTYELPCQLDWMFDIIEPFLFVQEVIILGRKRYQMNGYTIEVE